MWWWICPPCEFVAFRMGFGGKPMVLLAFLFSSFYDPNPKNGNG
jgi:hypothetical protein